MKRTMKGEMIEPKDLRPGIAIKFNIKSPGIIRRTLLTARKAELIQGPQDPQIELVPTIIFEIDPDAEEKERIFAIVPAGKTIESENHIEYRGEFLFPDGNILFLYEELDVLHDVMEILRSKRA